MQERTASPMWMDSGQSGQRGPSVMRPVEGANSGERGRVAIPFPVGVGRTAQDTNRR